MVSLSYYVTVIHTHVHTHIHTYVHTYYVVWCKCGASVHVLPLTPHLILLLSLCELLYIYTNTGVL